jgi:flagellar biosynthesis protein FlhF
MRIRTIAGDTLSAAMAKVREELGPDAIILHVEDAKSRKGVLVRAAAETLDREASASDTPASPEAHIETRLEQELRARLRVFQPTSDTGQRIDPEAQIAPALRFHRVPEALTTQLVSAASDACAADCEAALAHALERAFGCGPLPVKPVRPLIALGAPGHGKTTALARLAAQATAHGHAVTLITLDTGKAGAVTQLETYGGLLKARVETCEDSDRLGPAIAACAPGSAIFIDTPGVNPWDARDMTAALQWVAHSDGEPLWIVSAETDTQDMAEIAKTYRGLGVRRMIATKLDAARRLGGIAAAAVEGRLSLAGITASPFLADGVERPNHLTFARRLIQSAQTSATITAQQGAKCA